VPPLPPLSAIRMTPPPERSGQAAPGDTIDNIRFWDTRKLRGALGRVDKSIYSAEYMKLCALLRELRREAGLTQVQVAEALGVPQSFVSKYESGERRLDVIELGHVAQALWTSLIEIVRRLDAE
jgi:DNA-binding XRE family transcriptional regulator